MTGGDLVKRVDSFKMWLKENSWMTLEEEQEIGIIVGLHDPQIDTANATIVVWWCHSGISWEFDYDLELLHALA